MPKGTRITGPVLGTDNSRAEERGWFAKLPVSPEPTVATIYNDFLLPSSYVAGDYDLVEGGTGTQAHSATANGALVLTTGATSGNFEGLFVKDLWHTTTVGQKVWHRSRLKASSETSVTLLFGLSSGNPNDRISFDVTTASSTTVKCTCSRGGTSTQVDTGKTIVWTDFNDFAFSTEGTSVEFWVNGSLVASINTNLPLPATSLRTSWLITTNSANARALTIDLFQTSNQRVVGGNL